MPQLSVKPNRFRSEIFLFLSRYIISSSCDCTCTYTHTWNTHMYTYLSVKENMVSMLNNSRLAAADHTREKIETVKRMAVR